jgi:hypothetical protein
MIHHNLLLTMHDDLLFVAAEVANALLGQAIPHRRTSNTIRIHPHTQYF